MINHLDNNIEGLLTCNSKRCIIAFCADFHFFFCRIQLIFDGLTDVAFPSYIIYVRESILFCVFLSQSRVKLPWTQAFAALPTICFGFMVCILLCLLRSSSCAVQGSLGLQCFVTSLRLSFVPPSFSIMRPFCSIAC